MAIDRIVIGASGGIKPFDSDDDFIERVKDFLRDKENQTWRPILSFSADDNFPKLLKLFKQRKPSQAEPWPLHWKSMVIAFYENEKEVEIIRVRAVEGNYIMMSDGKTYEMTSEVGNEIATILNEIKNSQQPDCYLSRTNDAQR